MTQVEKVQAIVNYRTGYTTYVRPDGLRHGAKARVDSGVLVYSEPFHDEVGRLVRFIAHGVALNGKMRERQYREAQKRAVSAESAVLTRAHARLTRRSRKGAYRSRAGAA